VHYRSRLYPRQSYLQGVPLQGKHQENEHWVEHLGGQITVSSIRQVYLFRGNPKKTNIGWSTSFWANHSCSIRQVYLFRGNTKIASEGKSLHHETSACGRGEACSSRIARGERGSHGHTIFGLQPGIDAKTNNRKRGYNKHQSISINIRIQYQQSTFFILVKRMHCNSIVLS
jgi:hypothetical protein